MNILKILKLSPHIRLPRMWVVREPAHWQCQVFRECRQIGTHSHSALELL